MQMEEHYSCELDEEENHHAKEESYIESEPVWQARPREGEGEKERFGSHQLLNKDELGDKARFTVSSVVNSPQVLTSKSSISPKRSLLELSKSIAEKPKSQELPFANRCAYSNRFETGTQNTHCEN